jgi:hypothetical protein
MTTTWYSHDTYPCPFCDRRLATDQVSGKSSSAVECCRRGGTLRRVLENSCQWPFVYPSRPRYDDILIEGLERGGESSIDSEWFSDPRGVALILRLDDDIHCSIGERRSLGVGENPDARRIREIDELLQVIRLLNEQRPRFEEDVFYHPVCWARVVMPANDDGVFSIDSGLMVSTRRDGELQIACLRWDFVLVGDGVIKSGETMAAAMQAHGVSADPAELQFLLDAGLRDHLWRSAKPGYWVPPKSEGAA